MIYVENVHMHLRRMSVAVVRHNILCVKLVWTIELFKPIGSLLTLDDLSYWEWGIKVPNYYYVAVYFFFQFC